MQRAQSRLTYARIARLYSDGEPRLSANIDTLILFPNPSARSRRDTSLSQFCPGHHSTTSGAHNPCRFLCLHSDAEVSHAPSGSFQSYEALTACGGNRVEQTGASARRPASGMERASASHSPARSPGWPAGMERRRSCCASASSPPL